MSSIGVAPLPLDEPGDLFLNPSAVGLVPWWFVTASDGESRAQRWNRGLDTLSLDGILIESGALLPILPISETVGGT